MFGPLGQLLPHSQPASCKLSSYVSSLMGLNCPISSPGRPPITGA